MPHDLIICGEYILLAKWLASTMVGGGWNLAFPFLHSECLSACVVSAWLSFVSADNDRTKEILKDIKRQMD